MVPLSYARARTPVCRAARLHVPGRRLVRRRCGLETYVLFAGYASGMSVALQGSLLDSIDDVGLRPLDAATRRTTLARGAWIDLRPGWLTGADELFTRLARDVPWHAERRQMYERQVDVPRLLSFYDENDQLPDPVLGKARRSEERRVGKEC